MSATGTTLLWFRRDLRLSDHPGLNAAIGRGGRVLPFYVWRPHEEQLGGASRVWLNKSLSKLDSSLRERGSRLFFFKGGSMEVVKGLVEKYQAKALFYHECTEPQLRAIDVQVRHAAEQKNVFVREFVGEGLASFESYRNKSNKSPYKVFTPFYNANLSTYKPSRPIPAPARIPPPPNDVSGLGLTLEELGICPKHPWTNKLSSIWSPGEETAALALEKYRPKLANYQKGRDFLVPGATSQISPHMAFGEISPREVWWKLRNEDAEKFLRQVCWREYGRMLLVEFPHTVSRPFQPEWEGFEWVEDDAKLKRWQRGQTGYPIVDACMRELWATGWLSNRARMIVCSFLVKNLRISWVEGAAWFWDTLVDADMGNNILGWQWIGGCGTDGISTPRVFNPMLQSKKFDLTGNYIRKWVPELAKLGNKHIHTPWEAPAHILQAAGVKLGENYPHKIVEHEQARNEFLKCYEAIGAPAGVGGTDNMGGRSRGRRGGRNSGRR